MLVNVRLHSSPEPPAEAPNPRPRDAAATRAALLRAAMRRFTMYGYEGTTTRDIAAAAGVNVSLIARYFGSKEGLYSAVLAESAVSVESHQSSDLVEEVIEGFRPDAWLEFGGEHPLLLLLRDHGHDDRAGELRRRSLAGAVARLTRQVQPGAAADDAAARLRGATVLAVVAGLLALRSSLPGDPFTQADEEALRAVLRDVVTAVSQPSAKRAD